MNIATELPDAALDNRITMPRTRVPGESSELLSTRFFPAPSLRNLKKENLVYSIRSYRAYEDDWDGYGGKAPFNATVEDTITFLRLFPDKFAFPYSGLAGDGQISLFWKQDNIFIELSFNGDGMYSCFARDSKGSDYYCDSVSVVDPLPIEIENIIKTIKS